MEIILYCYCCVWLYTQSETKQFSAKTYFSMGRFVLVDVLFVNVFGVLCFFPKPKFSRQFRVHSNENDEPQFPHISIRLPFRRGIYIVHYAPSYSYRVDDVVGEINIHTAQT